MLLLTSLILIPLLCTLIPVPERLHTSLRKWVAVIPALQFLILLSLWPEVQAGEKLASAWAWLPEMGFHLSLALDGLSWLFACLISGMGILVFYYTASYLEGDPRLFRLYRFLLLFNSAMMGVVLADNLVLLFIFWELTSVASFLLIGFNSERKAACEGASKALLITGSGGLVMLMGVFLTYADTGTFELSTLLTEHPHISTAAGLCFLVGAFTKSAQVPFHIWLPSAMEAPTPVSAYLHAATMVKAGIYLVARLTPLFSADPVWSPLVTGVGLVTLLWGGVLACKQTDLKGLLANSTVSQLGLIMALLGVHTKLALTAAILHIVNHAAFKGALFLTAGAVDHATGTRDLRKLGGLYAMMPLTAIAATLAALSMAGMPPLGGFVSKELFYEAMLESGALPIIISVAGSCFTLLYSAIFFYGTFFGKASESGNEEPVDAQGHAAHHNGHGRHGGHAAHETEFGMLLPIMVLNGIVVLFGLIPGIPGALISPAVRTFLHGHEPHLHLALWHGLSPALGLSAITVAIGGCAFFLRQMFLPRLRTVQAVYSCNRAYTDGIAGFNRMVLGLRKLYMTGSITDYIRYILLVLLIAAGIPLGQFFGAAAFEPDTSSAMPHEIGLAILMAMGGIACCFLQSRILLLLALGLIGALVSAFFILFSAPDLALTQIIVEAITLVLFLLVFRFFTRVDPARSERTKTPFNIGLSVATGSLVALLLLAANIGQLYPSQLTPFFFDNSYVLAGGKNVVNVILVDFRGYDTMGEITVFSVAALAVFALAKLGPRPAAPALGGTVPASSPILQATARLTLHLMLLFSVYLLLRGHNEPGGGFIAGMLTSLAIILQMVAFDLESFKKEIPWNPLRIVFSGLTLSAVTGTGALVFGQPFMTSAFGHFHLPLLGDVELASAMFFDIGVYLVVVGTTLAIIRTIAEE